MIMVEHVNDGWKGRLSRVPAMLARVACGSRPPGEYLTRQSSA
jgi:hypothetical protein